MLSRDHNILWLPESNGYPTNEIVFPFAPSSGLYPIYLDVGDDTVVENEVIQAIYRKFGDRSEMD